MATQGYRQLEVWQKAMDLAVETSRLACHFPTHEKYALAAQLRRAAFSVPLNIAEGNASHYRREYVHHLSIARASVAEVETALEIGCRLSYFTATELEALMELSDHVSRMLMRLMISLRSQTWG